MSSWAICRTSGLVCRSSDALCRTSGLSRIRYSSLSVSRDLREPESLEALCGTGKNNVDKEFAFLGFAPSTSLLVSQFSFVFMDGLSQLIESPGNLNIFPSFPANTYSSQFCNLDSSV